MEILKPLHDVTTKEGESFIMECELSKPDIPARWFKDGQEIIPSDHYRLSVDGNVHRLQVATAMLEDEADYSIEVKDKTCKAMVLVEGKIILKLFSFHSSLYMHVYFVLPNAIIEN